MHSYSQLYLPRLQSYQIELLERLELLVNIDSGTGQLEGINSIISCLQQWFSDIGFATALHNSTLYGNNLVARRTGRATCACCWLVMWTPFIPRDLLWHIDFILKMATLTVRG